MRFTNIASQNEIDAHLRRAKPRLASAPPLPWMPALFGLTLLLALQTLL
jgi:hypothetical protein